MPKITIENLQLSIEALPGQSLLNSLLYGEAPIHTVCGGRARCGCCRVRILDGMKGATPVNEHEKMRLNPEQIAAGWRLACQLHLLRDISLYLPTAEELDIGCSRK